MPFSDKKYNVSKEHKKGTSISTPTGTYTKIKSNSYCKNCPHRPPKSLTPSSSTSSTSSNSSSKGLISRLPKQKNSKKIHKIL